MVVPMARLKYDALIVLCGGLAKNGAPNPWVLRRLDKVLAIRNQARFILIPGRSTPYKPPHLSKEGFPEDESVISAEYLLKRGTSKKKIFLQRLSVDTIGDAFFTRLILTDPMKLKKILVITSDHHMPRAKKIFERIFSLKPLSFRYHLGFLTASDKNLDPKTINARAKKEKEHLSVFLKHTKSLKTMPSFHRWLFTRHGAYSFGGKIWTIKNPNLLKSY